jgi:small-conductance mechanosensitive channel
LLARRGLTDEGGATSPLNLLHYLILPGGFAIALHSLGIEQGALFMAVAVFAVGLSLAIQNIAHNFVGGHPDDY